MFSAGDEEAEGGFGDGEFRGGQGAGGGVSAVSGGDPVGAFVALGFSAKSFGVRGDRGEAEGFSLVLPFSVTVALEIFEDLGGRNGGEERGEGEGGDKAANHD